MIVALSSSAPRSTGTFRYEHGKRMSIDVGDELRVVAGNPTPEELAAVISVLQAMSAELIDASQAEPKKQSAWAASQRPIRTPIVPGHTRWRSFG